MSLLMLAFVSGCATALTGVRRAQLWNILSSEENVVLETEARIASYRSSLVALRIAGVVGAISSVMLLAADLSDLSWWVLTIAGFASAVLIVAAEAPPRSWAAASPERVTRTFAVPLAIVNTLARPITRWIPLSSEAAFSRSFAGPVRELGPMEEAQHLKEWAVRDEAPTIGHDEREMIRSILSLNETVVKEIMVPRPDFIAAPSDAGFEEVIDTFVSSGRSRIPVYLGTLDNIIGVVYARDLLAVVKTGAESFDVTKIMRPPYFIPETKRVPDLLEEFQEKAVHFALVVDEHGGVEGLVTLKDVLEEIVGEIDEEFQTSEEPLRLVTELEAVVDGRVSLEDINEALGLELQGEDFDTISGFVLHHFGRVPKPGERIEVDGVLIRVESTLGRRIKKVRVMKLVPEQNTLRAAS